MSLLPPAPPPPLTLTIRFTTSLPDLRLPIASPLTSNPATLSTLIRPHLPPHLSTCPLRLIHAGALLPAASPLSTSLRLPAHPPPHTLYIHCSIPTETHLTAADLAAEKLAATSLLHGPAPPAPLLHPTTTTAEAAAAAAAAAPPQGFDRLLSAGLAPPEIASLRSQFLALHAHAHTPDTMPSAAEMRALEEAWLDGGDVPGGNGINGINNAGAVAGAGAGELEDMLWGNLMGFFWAVGAVVWLVREEGVWSRRRRVGVVTGVLVNVAFCFMRVGG